MKERPILFSGPMVQAIMEGRKTQTRRVVKPQPDTRIDSFSPADPGGFWGFQDIAPIEHINCPYGQPGDRLWVRETWLWVRETWLENAHGDYLYKADWTRQGYEARGMGWKPSIHMPRRASRITLEVTGVRIERLTDISEQDAQAEGWDLSNIGLDETYDPVQPWCADRARQWFVGLWDQINGKTHPWASNPWVWVIAFKRVTP